MHGKIRCVLAMTCVAIMTAPSLAGADDPRGTVEIQGSLQLPPDPIACERIPLGEADDYKPCIARLPDGELVLTAFHQHKREGNKVMEQTLLFRSRDGGKPLDRIRDLNDYGEMYMSLLRLRDKRLLLTFTVRDLHLSLGVRAIPGVESDDGFTFDFTHDRVMLDTKTASRYQGGGFGPTVQLDDGTLVTSCSYRVEDDKTHLEVIRWKLPESKPAKAAPKVSLLIGPQSSDLERYAAENGYRPLKLKVAELQKKLEPATESLMQPFSEIRWKTVAPCIVSPEGPAVNRADNVYLVSRWTGRVVKVDPSGQVSELVQTGGKP